MSRGGVVVEFVSQKSLSQQRLSSACCIPPTSPFPVSLSLSLSPTYTLSLALSLSSWNHCVLWFTNPASVTWSNTSNIQHIFYQPQNARRQGKQGLKILGFNLLNPHHPHRHLLPPPLSFFVSKSVSLSLPSLHLPHTVSQHSFC